MILSTLSEQSVKKRLVCGQFHQRHPLQSQLRKGKPPFSMKQPQRGQRPGSFHGSTKCFASTGHIGMNFCHTNLGGWIVPGRDVLSRRITGGISGRKKPGNFTFSAAPARRRTLMNTSYNCRQSRQLTV